MIKKELIETKVLYKKHLTDDLVIIGFDIEMDFKAGQFFQLIIDKDNIDDRTLGFRPYSILTSPEESKSKKIIETFVKIIPGGRASGYILSLKEGDDVLLRGPYGKFVFNTNSTNHVFLSTGTGITPIFSMIKEYINKGHDMTLFYSARTSEELIFHKEFQELEKNNGNFDYYPTLTREESKEWTGLKGRIQNHLNIMDMKTDVDIKNKTFYICGLKDFIVEMRQALIDKDVQANMILFERYD
jgi:NAD(P)H-flavin reductase